jgi:hypothetical protein
MTTTTRLRIVGGLFLAAFLAYGTGATLTTAILEAADPTAALLAQQNEFMIGGILMLLNSFIVAAIGILISPTLTPYSRSTAGVYLLARLAEAALLGWGIITLLLLTCQASPSIAVIHAAMHSNFLGYQTSMALLGLGSLFFCALLYRRRLVPRWLAGWGFVGYAVFLAGAVLELAGFPYGIPLSIPGGLFEVVFGIRLIAYGFDRPG